TARAEVGEIDPTSFERRATRRCERAAHRHAAAIGAVELQTLDETAVGEALEAPLGRRRGLSPSKPAVDLAAERVTERRKQPEDLDVDRVELEWPRMRRRR